MADDKYTLEDILSPGFFDERITDIGTKEEFIEWWNSTIYHRIKHHDVNKVDRILNRYERFISDKNGYLALAQIETEFPELYAPDDDRLYVFLPDACQEKEFRLTILGGDGMIIAHKAFDDRESALRYASKKGCTEERPGMMDDLVGTKAFNRSLVTFEAIKNNMTLDQYIMRSRDKETRLLFKERIVFLKSLKREESALSM